jgi:ribosomal protein L7/L12
MSKQTATEYLIQEIKNDSLVQAKSTQEWNEVFKKAKQMERDQIVKAHRKTKAQKREEAAIIGNTLLAAVAHQKIDLIKEYLEPTGVTITELIDRNAFASLCQLLDAYILEAVRNSR